jgi:hypothetical protein
MFTIPSVTITPVYNTTQHKQKCHTIQVSAVTVQIEPVDLSTQPTYHGVQSSTVMETAPYQDLLHNGHTGVQDREKLIDWRKNKKIHQCGHPGCEKVRKA